MTLHVSLSSVDVVITLVTSLITSSFAVLDHTIRDIKPVWTKEKFGGGENMFRWITKHPKLKLIALVVLGYPTNIKEVEKLKEIFTAFGATNGREHVNVVITHSLDGFCFNKCINSCDKGLETNLA